MVEYDFYFLMLYISLAVEVAVGAAVVAIVAFVVIIILVVGGVVLVSKLSHPTSIPTANSQTLVIRKAFQSSFFCVFDHFLSFLWLPILLMFGQGS